MYKAIVITAINKMSRASEFSEPLLAATLPMLSRQSRKSLLVTSAMTELRHYAAMKRGQVTGGRLRNMITAVMIMATVIAMMAAAVTTLPSLLTTMVGRYRTLAQ